MPKQTKEPVSDRKLSLAIWVSVFALFLLAAALWLFRLVTWPFWKPKGKGFLEDFTKASNDPYGPTKRGPLPALDTTPDDPLPFGDEIAWLAIHSDSHADVVAVLPVDEVQSANWKTGLEAVEQGYTFITPVLNGWVIVASKNLARPEGLGWDGLMQALSKRFQEAQFFEFHDEHDCCYAWSKYRDGVEERTLVYSIEAAAGVACERGSLSKEESQLGLSSLDYENRPELENALRLAGLWSINPQTLHGLGLPKSVGAVGLIRRTVDS